MALINAVEVDRIDTQTQRMYQRQTRAFGYLPNFASLFSWRPQVIDLWAELQRELRRNVSSRMFELVTFAAALTLQSSYCSLAHGTRLRDHFNDAELQRLATGEYDGIVTEGEAAAMRYACRIARNPAAVTAADIAPLRRAGYSDAQVFDIAAIAAGRAFFASLVEGLGAEPDPEYRNLPDALRNALTVGRDIQSAD